MIYDIRHTTTYTYDATVSVSHHVARLAPRALDHQEVLSSIVEIDPTPTVIREQSDYYGNRMSFIAIQGEHEELRVTARSQVKMSPRTEIDLAASAPWEQVREFGAERRLTESGRSMEFAFGSPFVKLAPEFADYARPSFPKARPVLAGAEHLMRRIFDEFEFDASATTVATPAHETLKRRKGVCQDFAHLMIACLRSLGLAARYVSGYLETLPPPGKPKLQGTDASHAWVAVFCPKLGWREFDPTNSLRPDQRHITLAWGRDYSDVSPIRGVIHGSGEHELDVAVDVLPRT